MKNIIIGTAGHIDHGKTTLIKALTGRNTDRWEEEQRRGITIDLGFTYFDLKNGDRVGIIDVPGHEKFINNMVAGVVGMDLVMLVVAADEGIMPQTREHMDILGLLGIEKSILVINKCDLVDEEWLELVEEEIKEELEGTFLEDAPIVEVSAATGEGIPHLIDVIEQMTAKEVEPKEINTIPRLPIDRAFTLSGFGTIITGTLLTGSISKEDVLEMYPIGKECRIRSIQVHGQDVDRCYAGQRVAINLSNVKKKEIARGCVLAPPNSMKNTMLLDVKLNMLPSSMRVLTNHARLHFFTGTSEVLCRAVLLDKEDLSGREWICAASSGRRGGIAKRRQICCPFLFSDGDNRGRCCSGAKSRAKEAFPAGCDRGTEAERIRFLRGYYRTSCQGACRDDGNTWGTCEIDCTFYGRSGGRCTITGSTGKSICIPDEERCLCMACGE